MERKRSNYRVHSKEGDTKEGLRKDKSVVEREEQQTFPRWLPASLFDEGWKEGKKLCTLLFDYKVHLSRMLPNTDIRILILFGLMCPKMSMTFK